MGDWCTIESDPAVFNEMLWSLGATSVEVEEIYSLDELQTRTEPSYGLIFLFKWRNEEDLRPVMDEDSASGLIFARQVITNACATQALLSIVLNLPELDIGDQLTELKGFMLNLDPETRGFAIGSSDAVRVVHNSFARPEPFVEDSKPEDRDSGDAHHFIAFVPYQDKIYELDGLKSGPIEVGAAGVNWQTAVYDTLFQRTSRFSADTHFALLSLRPRRTHALQLAIAEAQSLGDSQTLLELQSELQELEAREEAGRQENVRRRHNFVPLAVRLLRLLAERGQLQPLLRTAREKQQQQQQQQKHLRPHAV